MLLTALVSSVATILVVNPDLRAQAHSRPARRARAIRSRSNGRAIGLHPTTLRKPRKGFQTLTGQIDDNNSGWNRVSVNVHWRGKILDFALAIESPIRLRELADAKIQSGVRTSFPLDQSAVVGLLDDKLGRLGRRLRLFGPEHVLDRRSDAWDSSRRV